MILRAALEPGPWTFFRLWCHFVNHQSWRRGSRASDQNTAYWGTFDREQWQESRLCWKHCEAGRLEGHRVAFRPRRKAQHQQNTGAPSLSLTPSLHRVASTTTHWSLQHGVFTLSGHLERPSHSVWLPETWSSWRPRHWPCFIVVHVVGGDSICVS